jgi:hypothetical protein
MPVMFTEQLTKSCIELWALCPDSFPGFPSTFTIQEKKERETVFADYISRFKSLEVNTADSTPKIDNGRFFSAFRNFMKVVYNYTDDALDIILHPSFTEVSRSFFAKARAFDSELKRDEIYQAMRNVWIMNGLQLLLGKPVELIPSVFAFSLLYPYSDNLLDDPSISMEDKISFSRRFSERLNGQASMGENRQERKISELVDMIEREYPKSLYPDVHKSLMAIHEAQTQSLRLLKSGNPINQEEIMTLVFSKGGASVLADGYLIAGSLTPSQQKFFFGYGVWLQLVDDIQDLKEDTESGTRTLFSVPMETRHRAILSNRTIHFGRAVMEGIRYCPSDVCEMFSKVIIHSIELMLVQSVGLNNAFFPVDYCFEMEKYSPVGFRFLRDAKKKGSPVRMKMISQLMEAHL